MRKTTPDIGPDPMPESMTDPTSTGTPATETTPIPIDPRRAGFEAEALAQLDALYGFALKLTHAPDDAEDLVFCNKTFTMFVRV